MCAELVKGARPAVPGCVRMLRTGGCGCVGSQASGGVAAPACMARRLQLWNRLCCVLSQHEDVVYVTVCVEPPRGRELSSARAHVARMHVFVLSMQWHGVLASEVLNL